MVTQVSKLSMILRAHEAELISSFTHANDRIAPYTFFTDRSFLTGDFLNIIQPEMLLWHFNMANMNDPYRPSRRHGIIRRILPILIREYSSEEIEQIKFSLHLQLLLGMEVILVFTDKSDYLHKLLGSDNLVVVRKMKVIDSNQAYDEDAPMHLEVIRERPVVEDIYQELGRLTEQETTIPLRYGEYTLTSGRIDLQRRYGDLLFNLQGGRCAMTGEPLVHGQWHIDHVYPISRSGNNSLINLRGTTKPANESKRDTVTESQYCFSPSQLHSYGLEPKIYRELADRKLEGLPLGFKVILGKDLRLVA